MTRVKVGIITETYAQSGETAQVFIVKIRVHVVVKVNNPHTIQCINKVL